MRTDDHPLHIQLCEAATRGDWKTAKNIEKTHKGILSEVIRKDRKETALHIATKFNNTAFVERLIEKLTEKELEATDVYGNTALCMAATLGAVDIANSMLQKNKDLVLIRGSQNATPILVAARYKQNHMVAYLLKEMDLSIQSMATSDQMELLLSAIATDHYGSSLLTKFNFYQSGRFKILFYLIRTLNYCVFFILFFYRCNFTHSKREQVIGTGTRHQ